MSENDYEYQCMRAELLGLPKPDKPEIDPNVSAQLEEENNDDNVAGVDELDLDVDGERYKRTTGGLDEISNILQNTQKKINRFKTVFGSVTSLLKGRASAEGSTENLRGSNSNINDGCAASSGADNDITKNQENSIEDGENISTSNTTRTSGVNSTGSKKLDVESTLASHIQTLDSMVNKADQINASMNHQNKQMRKFINK